MAAGEGRMSAQVFDYAGLCERVDGRVDVIDMLIDLLLSTYPGDRDGLQRLVERGDAAGLRELAHRLKGQLQTLGVDCAAAVALRLELMGRAANLAEAGCALQDLDHEMGRFQSMIAERRAGR
jgi:HPt (histidine-containing phosphotransfer) domain-containing protein